MRGAFVAVVMIAACGDDRVPKEWFSSGQRLRARYDELPGGVRLFRDFFDTARGEPCFFEALVGPTGRDYCLPTNHAALFPDYQTSFVDPTCTQPAIDVDGDPSVVLVVPVDACATDPAVHELGPAVTMYTKGTDGSCTPTTYPNYHQLGAEIPLDKFVSAQVEHDTTSSRIDSLALVGDDGSRLVIAGWDNERNERVDSSGELATHWLPRGIAYMSDDFADAACSRPVATKYGDSAWCPVTTIILFNSNGDGAAGVAAAGPRVDPSALFKRDATGQCIPHPSQDPSTLFFEIGAPFSRDALASATTVRQGSGRIQHVIAASPQRTAVVPVSDYPLFDTTTNEPCELLRATDGVVRCLPGQRYRGYFADAACTNVLVQSDDVVPLLVSMEQGDGTFVVRRVGPPHTPPMYVLVASTCMQVPGGGGYNLLGDVVAPTLFEAATSHD